MKVIRKLLGWVLGLLTIFWRLSCRIKHLNDSRHAYLQNRESFSIALLHAHMITGVLG